VYATEPSVLLGRLFMEEMAEFLNLNSKYFIIFNDLLPVPTYLTTFFSSGTKLLG
jgi:hypothetical protein